MTDIGHQREAADDPLQALRDQLAAIDGVPIDERLARFEAANATLSAALAELDEV